MGAEQGSAEWRRERLGFATASRFKDVIAKPKSGTGYSASRRNYRMQLALERLTGVVADGFTNAATQWGNDHEKEARRAFEIYTGKVVIESPFVPHPDLPWCGGSPDGLLGNNALVQIKCPYTSATHIEYLEDNRCPPEYRAQVQGELWVTRREYTHFCSYDPRMPENLRLFHVKVWRDDDYIAMLAREIGEFLSEVASTVRHLNGMGVA